MAIEKQKTILIISESTKIYSQISKEIGNSINIESSVKSLQVKPGFIHVAMAQTLSKRPFIVSQFQNLGKDLIIIADEAHIGTTSKLLKQFFGSFIIGFTATPDFRFAKHLPQIYNDIVVGEQPQGLVEMGFLSPYHHYERKTVDLTGLKKSSTGDYTEQSQELAFEKTKVYEGIWDDIKKFPYKKCMVFTASINHAEDVAQKFRANGFNVACCHSKNPQSNYELFKFQTRDSGTDICISVASLTKGFDEPSVDLIILLRATLSLPLYLQMIGRGSRLSEFTGKTKFNVLDYGGNCTRHGLWNYEIDWEQRWKGKPKKKGDGIAPVKECPSCGYMMHPNIMICPDCGFVFKKKEVSTEETELVEMNQKYNTLRGRKISSLSPEELVAYAKITNKKKYAIRVAKSKNDFDFLESFAARMGYKQGFAYAQVTDEKIEFHDIIIK